MQQIEAQEALEETLIRLSATDTDSVGDGHDHLDKNLRPALSQDDDFVLQEVNIIDDEEEKKGVEIILEDTRAMTPTMRGGTKQMTPPQNTHHVRNQSHDEDLLRTSSPLEGFTDEVIFRVHSQVTVTTNTSEDIVLGQTKMAPTKQRPASGNLATQQRASRLGSFVSSDRQIDNARYRDRVPVRIVFKNKELMSLGEKNLTSRVVMALQSLTVNEFLEELLHAMQAPRHIRKSRIQIGFLSKSAKFPIHFAGQNLMEKVFHKIHSIEENRELSKNSSSEDLNKLAAAQQASDTQEISPGSNVSAKISQKATYEPIIAELDMIDGQSSEGKSGMKLVRRHRRRQHESRSGQKKRSHSLADDSEKSSCTIF